MKKSYIYSNNSQIFCQRDGGQTADEYFYVNDPLGSVRQVIDMYGSVVRNYTYSPFGQMLEEGGTFDNNFKFTGQWFDDEISQYYLRARMYDPIMMRFTARDPVRGKPQNPLTSHVYLYCLNNPINATDPSGEFLGFLFSSAIGSKMRVMSLAMGGRAMAFAGKIYAAAFVRAVGVDLFMYNLTYKGKVVTPRFRGPEWGKWGPRQSIEGWHFHLPWGPGLGEKHLPQQFHIWWKNFVDLYLKWHK